MIATGVKRKPPKFFQVLEFIGHQETSSGCGLMGLGEKMLSPSLSLFGKTFLLFIIYYLLFIIYYIAS